MQAKGFPSLFCSLVFPFLCSFLKLWNFYKQSHFYKHNQRSPIGINMLLPIRSSPEIHHCLSPTLHKIPGRGSILHFQEKGICSFPILPTVVNMIFSSLLLIPILKCGSQHSSSSYKSRNALLVTHCCCNIITTKVLEDRNPNLRFGRCWFSFRRLEKLTVRFQSAEDRQKAGKRPGSDLNWLLTYYTFIMPSVKSHTVRGSLFPAGMEGPSSSKRSVCHLYRDLGMRKLIIFSFWWLPRVMEFLDCECLLHFVFFPMFSLVPEAYLDLGCALIYDFLITMSTQALLPNKVKLTSLGMNASVRSPSTGASKMVETQTVSCSFEEVHKSIESSTSWTSVLEDLTGAQSSVEPGMPGSWFGCKMSSTGSYVWTLGLQCVVLFWEAVEVFACAV